MAAPIFKTSYVYSNDFLDTYTLSNVVAVAGDVIIVAVSGRDGIHDFNIPTWNGESFTQIGSFIDGPATLEVFSLKCASSGTFTITGNGSGFWGLNAVALVYGGSFGASFITGFTQNNYISGTFTLPSVSIASIDADSLAIDILAATLWDDGYSAVATTYSTTGTSRASTQVATNTPGRLYASDKTGSGTVVSTYTKSDANYTQYRIAGFKLYTYTAGPSVDSYPSTVRSGSTGNTYTTTSLSSVSGITIGTLAATSISDTSGDGTHSVPSLVDGVAYELYGTRTVIFTGVGGSPTTTTNFQPLSTQNYVTLSGTLNTTNTGVLYNFSPAAVVGDQIVFFTADNTSVDAQGNLATDFVGTQQMWHIQASTKVARSYDVTTGESAGLTVSITGVAGTGTVGTVTPILGATGLTVAITGVAGTGTVGTVVPSLGSGADITVAISGVAGTGTVGAVTPVLGATTLTVGITGVSGTGTVGTVTTTLTDYIVRVSTDLPKFIVSVAKSIRRSFKKSFRKK